MNQKAEVTRHSSFTLTTQCELREHTLDCLKHLFKWVSPHLSKQIKKEGEKKDKISSFK